MEIKNKTVIVTGGASGLGAAVVERLTASGARCVIADLNEEAGKKMAGRFPDQVVFHATNVADESSAQAAVDLAWSRFQNLHGLVNCAGIGIPEKVVDKEGNPHKLKTFAKVIEVNLIGTFNMIRLAAASMVKNNPQPGDERGVIINTASVAAFEGQIGQASYSASKGGIVALGLPLAREFAPLKIRVMTIAPGLFDTPMMAGLPEKVRVSLGEQVPFPSRLGKPDEYAQLVQQIFENPMLNGEVIRLDGAIRLAPR